MQIAICITHYNRINMLVNHFLPSLNMISNNQQIILSIFDFQSSELYNIIRKYWKGELVFHSENKTFHKTYGINKAVDQVETDYIFLCDTDMSLPANFIDLYFENVGIKKVWFPICFSLYENQPKIIDTAYGYWRHTGFGMVGIRKEEFIENDRMDLRFISWGGEDNDFYDRSVEKKYIISRENCTGLFHNWHPVKKFGIDIDG